MSFGPNNPLTVVVEAALGADLTADPATWTWTALAQSNGKTRVLTVPRVAITRGRADENQQTQPATASLQLLNTDGQMTPRLPASSYYGQWKRGTPIRTRLTVPGVGGPYTRFQGRVQSIAPTWPNGNSTLALVDVQAKGTLYRLGLPNTPVVSPLKAAILADSPVAYWPAEDGSSSTQIAAAAGGVPMSVTGDAPTFGSGGPVGSSPLITFATATTTTGLVNTSSSVTAWTVEFYVKIPSAPSVTTPVIQWQTLGSEIQWRFTVFPGTTQLGMEVWNFAGNQVSNLKVGYTTPDPYGKDLFVTVAARQNGAAIQYEWIAHTSTGTSWSSSSGSIASSTLGPIIAVQVPPNDPGGTWDRSSWTYGHIAVWGDDSLESSWGALDFDHYTYMTGLTGEDPSFRMTSAGSQAGVTVTLRNITGSFSADPGQAMGPRPIATPLAVMRETELADFGMLTDGMDDGLEYLGGQDRYNLPVSFTMDGSLGQARLPFAPVEDDQRLANKVTVARSSGSSAVYTDSSTSSEGEYPASFTLNVQDDTLLLDQASWRAHLTTIQQMRAPVITLNLRDNPELISSWLAMDLGARYQATNLPLTQFPAEGVDLVLEQYTEVFDQITWNVQLVGSPYQPWHGFVLDTDRLDAEASTLVSNVSAGATSISVATTAGYPLWTTSGSDFPLDVQVGGVKVHVTAISGSSSPQTFTCSALTAAVTAGDSVSLWDPAYLCL